MQGHLNRDHLGSRRVPDACIVQTHRDHVEAIASTASLLMIPRQMLEGAAADPWVIARRNADVWHLAVQRAMQARKTHADNFFDVDFRAFNRDPLKVVNDIYRRFDIMLEPAVLERMRLWLAENPADKHGPHRYAPEDFGLTAAALRKQYGDYIEHFGLDCPGP